MAKKDNKLQGLQGLLEVYGLDKPTAFVDSGVDVLNEIWGGGCAAGSSYSLWGPAGCGKSTLSAQVARSFCRQGKKVVLLDSERAWNDKQLESFGLSQFKSGGLLFHLTVRDYSELEEICKALSDSDDGVSLVIIDSISEIEAFADKGLTVRDCRPGVKALQASFVLPRIKRWFADSDICSLWLFHARANMQMGPVNPYASQTKQDGGFAAQHVPDVITKVTAGSKIKEKNESGEEQTIGNTIYVETTKNKFCRPFDKREAKLIFGLGISRRVALIDKALDSGAITRAGASYILPWGVRFVGAQKLYAMPAEVLQQLRDFMSTGVLPEGSQQQ